MIYGVPEVDTCNKERVKLFCIGRTLETLPPTSYAAKFHIMHSHYQASVRNQAHFTQLPKWDVCIGTVGYYHGCFLCHLSRKLAGRSPHVAVRRGDSANVVAAGKFRMELPGVQLQDTW